MRGSSRSSRKTSCDGLDNNKKHLSYCRSFEAGPCSRSPCTRTSSRWSSPSRRCTTSSCRRWEVRSPLPSFWWSQPLRLTVKLFFLNGPSPASFSLFSSFQYTVGSKKMFNINKFLPMAGFERRTSGIGSDRSTNWATTTVHWLLNCCLHKLPRNVEAGFEALRLDVSEWVYGLKALTNLLMLI